MARSIEVIYNQFLAKKAEKTQLDVFNSTSVTAIWRLWGWVFAACINLFEQILDIFKSDIEARIVRAGVGSIPWLRDQILVFQVDDDVQYSEGVIAYQTTDTTKQIITRCSVTQDGNRVVKAKVAKSEPPEPLDSDEQTQLIYYLDQIRFAGTQINLISQDPDLLYVEAEIQYQGQFAGNIEPLVITALEAYCAGLSTIDNFNGQVEVNAVEDSLQAVSGVVRVKLIEVATRAYNQAFADRSIIYSLSGGINLLKIETVSGYIVQETDSGHTFADSITYTAV